MREFELLEPATVQEASRLLTEHGEDARIFAGGTALILGLRQRMLSPTHLVSLAGVDALHGITWDAQLGLRIGALTRHAQIASSPLVRQHCPMLASMAARVANPQVRNQGTLGGNLCYGDPSTDPPGCLLALDARVRIGGLHGERELTIEELLVDYFQTALAPDEVLIDVRIPPMPANTRGVYTRFLRTAAEHRPLASVALVARHEDLLCQTARLAVGASTPIPTRVPRAEAFLENRTMDAQAVRQAAAIVAQDIEPVSDARGDAEYRRHMVQVAAARTMAELFGIDIEQVEGVAA
ncbi:xanthine dehydrogenase family protein subunit M [Variovorax dokdonensis]|uniref:Xanthine dehydrogenase family protein subunit M n=1 Tax=Variovorax dokdonensis TaxID=344883 RepID=A0ABT7NCU4_9BURK|nr:xanthine dehydrogenase family protein subunit M [Variovorax dokdonensis]MDM0045781.1 xanthine dehydrogenase family protein subunit M [Variovorax dokdonensis]